MIVSICNFTVPNKYDFHSIVFPPFSVLPCTKTSNCILHLTDYGTYLIPFIIYLAFFSMCQHCCTQSEMYRQHICQHFQAIAQDVMNWFYHTIQKA